jgi:hypothetical protein
MYSHLKDQLDNLLSIPVDASSEDEYSVSPRRKDKRPSLFNHAKFKEDIGYCCPINLDTDEDKQLSDSTESESGESRHVSFTSVSQYFMKPVMMKNLLKPNYMKTIEKLKQDVRKRYTESSAPLKLNINSSEFFPRSFGLNHFGSVCGNKMFHEQMFN